MANNEHGFRRHLFWLPMALAVGALVAGCNSNGDGFSGGDGDAGGGGGGGGTGTATFSVTDAPADNVTNVWVSFDRIEVKPQSGPPWLIELEEARRIDLLQLQGEAFAVLAEDVELPAGRYNWLRLYVIGGSPESEVREGAGGHVGLYVPGNHPPSRNPNQRFVQLSRPFVIPEDDHVHFTIDVELRKALVDRGDFYMLRPSLRLVDQGLMGSIRGTVDDALVMDEACENDLNTGAGNAVYVYDGANATPGDVYVDDDGQERERTDGAEHPETVANVAQDPDTGAWEYTVGFLPAGDYTVAFTCQALLDDPDTEDEIAFAPVYSVSVDSGERVELPIRAEDL